VIETITGKLICEMSELAALGNREIEVVKSFFSRSYDTARLAYRRDPQELARTCVFAGTTNSRHYLLDQENRRFWCVTCGIIDLLALAQDREQLWAEAVVAARSEESLELPQTLWEAANIEAEKRRIDDPMLEVWTAKLKNLAKTKPAPPLLNHPEKVGVWVYGIDYPCIFVQLDLKTDTPVLGHSVTGRRIREAMRRNGWNMPRKFKKDGHSVRYYWREGEEDVSED
jgi:Virulence-associated protein E